MRPHLHLVWSQPAPAAVIPLCRWTVMHCPQCDASVSAIGEGAAMRELARHLVQVHAPAPHEKEIA